MLEHPALALWLAAAIVLVVPRRVAPFVGLAAPLVALVQLRAIDRHAPPQLEYYGFTLTPLRLDDLSTPFAIVFIGAAFVAGLYGFSTLTRREWAGALVTVGAALGVVLAGDLLTLFVMWEVKAVASATLIAGSDPARRGAALRYLLVHIVGGSLLLGGIAWHLSQGGGLEFTALPASGASVAVLAAFLIAAAAPPLHAWLPDAYPSASIAGTVFLAAFTTKAAVYALLRGFPGHGALLAVGVVMAVYGVVFAMMENDIRRLLSYHIVSQVGFMVAAVGVASSAAVNGATAHAFAHILYKGLLLMGAGAVIAATGRHRLSDLGGLWRRTPLVCACTAVGALSIAGIPLFSGFVSKELVIEALYAAEHPWAVQLLKLASVGTFLSVVVKLLWFTFGGEDRGLLVRPLPRTMLTALVIGAVANIAIGLWPAPFYELMPSPVGYDPFSATKLIEVVQLLGLAGIAAMALIARMRPSPGMTLDTDWIYRGAPLLLGARLGPLVRRSRAAGAPAIPSAVASVRARVDRARPVGTVPSTAALGAAVLVAALVVLASGVIL